MRLVHRPAALLAAAVLLAGCSFEQLTRRDAVELLPKSIVVKAQPSGVAVGEPIATPPAVEVRNLDDEALGDTTLGDTTLVVRVASSEPGDQLTGAETRVDAKGVAVFTALRIVGKVAPTPMRRLTFTLVDQPKVAAVTSSELPLGAGAATVIAPTSALSQVGTTQAAVVARPRSA